MAERLAPPFLFPNHPTIKTPFSNQTNQHLHQQNPTSQPNTSPPSKTPVFQDLLLKHNSKFQQPVETQARTRNRLGRSRDLNRGKRWTHNNLSAIAQQVLNSLIDPSFDSNQLDIVLARLFEQYQENPDVKKEYLIAEVLGIVKALGFYKNFDLALGVFNWVKARKDCELVLNNSVVAVMISMLGKVGKVSVAANLFNGLHKEGFSFDVYAYTSLITAYASSGRYREAMVVFKKTEEEGCKPTLITYNVILNVYGKMGMPWSKVMALVDGMKSNGVAPDAYTYNTFISCCRRGSLHEEVALVFDKMKFAGFSPDNVTYNALLDVYGKSRRPKEAMEVLKEMELNGFSPSIMTYNSLISAYARDGLLEEAMDLKTQMEGKSGRKKKDQFLKNYFLWINLIINS